MHKTLIDYIIYWGEHRGNNIAIIDSDRQITYKEMLKEVKIIQDFILNNFSITEDSFLISGEKSVSFITTYLALLGLGRNVIPVPDPLSFKERVEYISTITNSKAIINANKKNINVSKTETISKPLATLKVCTIEKDYKKKIELPINLNRENYYNLTSGSTGEIKITKSSNYKLIENAKSVNYKYVLEEGDVYCCFFSLEMHPHELFVKPLIAGATAVLLTTADLKHIKTYMESYKITHILSTPSILKYMLTICQSKEEWSHIKSFLIGGEVVSNTLSEDYHNITSKMLTIAWGSTETNGIAITLPEELAMDKRDLLGYALKGYKIKTDNITNELLIKGDSLMNGYINSSNSNVFTEDGFYKTGDIVSIDDTGLITYRGRKDSIIKINGIKVNLEEIEKEIKKRDYINKCVVVYNSITNTLFIFINFNKDMEQELQSYLHEKYFSISYRLIYIKRLKYLSNGKVDKQGLLNDYIKNTIDNRS